MIMTTPPTSTQPASTPPLVVRTPWAYPLQGWPRRVLFVLSFEVMAISCSSLGLSVLSEQSMSHASVMGLTCSAIAVAWNWVFNVGFEAWEARQRSQARTVWRRVAHAALCFGLPVGLKLAMRKPSSWTWPCLHFFWSSRFYTPGGLTCSLVNRKCSPTPLQR